MNKATKKLVGELESLLGDKRMDPLLKKLIELFENEDLVVDKRGKTLMEWAKLCD